MAHFLAYPGSLLRDVRNRMIGDVVSGKRKIYLSRLGDKKREMTNEAELEQRLVDRGFEIVRPEKLSIQKQIDLLKGSSVVAGAVGAAMTNCLFLPSGANIFEIQPSNYQDSFVRSMCDVLSMNWYPFFCQSPRDETSVMVEGKERHGYFSFDLPLEAFLAFIDGAMPQERTVGKKSRTPSLGWLGFSR
jgi:capsular polysaccharide biosynthesis protein